eukprot:CAMPEP_0197835632 /NCGR_PEP_ID=MMETSP1437-20131217/26434_1 /TAXON_ID=49252 ORGANISM="Eucampia antarctica, Strain CCMP1452" /NCGR_SAMPLE_ID=MMETSP1437 /ASSEMBLY_ACC=CAM_ASM_001096 /LENGTH=771 /DNA_ID=CAMNT_0043441225 /DNA_START=8 /DNA_END=2323 /DNA_ORIENTATION=+
MAATVAAVPTNPYNEKNGAGPLLNLCEALREDNRAQLVELLRLEPSAHHQFQGSTEDYNNNSSYNNGSNEGTVAFRQRLVFSDRSVRNMMLRHVLPDESSRNSGKKKAKRTFGEEEDFPPLPKGLGIVGTRCLMLDDTIVDNLSVESDSLDVPTNIRHDDHGSAEVIFDKVAALASAVFSDDDAEDSDFSDEPDVILYFLRSNPAHARAVASKIKKWDISSSRSTTNYHGILRHRVVFLPNASLICERILLDEGILPMDTVSLHSLPIDLIPLDTDIISLEMTNIIKDSDIQGCPSESVSTIAQSLIKIQDISGVVPRVQSLGPLGEAVLTKMMNIRLDEYDYHNEDKKNNNTAANGGSDTTNIDMMSSTPAGNSDINAIILLDRKVDLVTPMLTPLTYEGLLDEVLGIDSGFVTVDENIIEPPDETEEDTDTSNNPFGEKTKMVALPLNDADTLYAEVRDQHVEKFGSFLQGQAKALKESHSNFTDKNKDLSEIHQFVKQIPIFTQNLRSLTNHIHLAELVKQTTEESEFRQRWQTERSMMESESCYDTLEDLISMQDPPYRILRLLCLQSLTSGGIKSSRYDSLRREVVQTYGYEFLFVLQNFEKIGLLRRRETLWMDTASSFASLRKMLKLINAEVNTVEPDDFAYVSSGYAPISIRLVQAATQGWLGKDELLRELPGRLVDVNQRDPPEDLSSALKRKPTINLGTLAKSLVVNSEQKPVLLVFFIGGVTFMEIAALRFLSKRTIFPYQIICCTTKIINGSSFLQSLS